MDAGTLLQAGGTVLEETPPPLRDDLTGHVQSLPDLLVLQTLGGKEGDLGSNDITICGDVYFRTAASSSLRSLCLRAIHTGYVSAYGASSPEKPVCRNVTILATLIRHCIYERVYLAATQGSGSRQTTLNLTSQTPCQQS